MTRNREFLWMWFKNFKRLSDFNFVLKGGSRKIIGYMWGGIKTIPRPQEFYRVETAPPILKFLDPTLMLSNVFTNFKHFLQYDSFTFRNGLVHCLHTRASDTNEYVQYNPVLSLTTSWRETATLFSLLLALII